MNEALDAPDTGGKDDTFDRYEGADGGWHVRFRLGPRDLSPTARRYDYPERGRKANITYDAACFGCWNGNAHSVAYHNANASKKS
jgi:hypothetical protein